MKKTIEKKDCVDDSGCGESGFCVNGKCICYPLKVGYPYR